MRTATWVRIDDKDLYDRSIYGTIYPEDLDGTDLLLENLLLPMGWSDWSDVGEHDLGPPPFHLIGELLLLMKQLKIPLAGLDIETPPPTASPSTLNTTTTYDPTVLRAAV
jgi:hypothetical protein